MGSSIQRRIDIIKELLTLLQEQCVLLDEYFKEIDISRKRDLLREIKPIISRLESLYAKKGDPDMSQTMKMFHSTYRVIEDMLGLFDTVHKTLDIILRAQIMTLRDLLTVISH